MFHMRTDVCCFLLPDDAKEAEAAFLAGLRRKGETWIIAYGFTLAPMLDELLEARRARRRIHIYVDHTQSTGHAQHADVQMLVRAGIDVTIGTSPVRGQICHSKGIVVDGATPWCWEGSVNFTTHGFEQVNTALMFRSQRWRHLFVEQFGRLRSFARRCERRWQPRSAAQV